MIEAYLDGAGEVSLWLGSLDARLTEEMRKSIERLAITLQTNVKNNKLAGQVLGVRTGNLRRSVQERVQVDGKRISGIVSTNIFYGVGWETGWQGAQERSLAAAKGKFALSGGGDTFKNGSPKKRPFLVPALAEMARSGQIEQEIGKAIKRATTP